MRSKTYTSWEHMRQRCDNPNHDQYKDYGGRGITYDPAWNSYKQFREDMGKRPDGYTLDRKDNDGPYCKTNCQWATWEQQQNNRRIPSNNTSGLKGVSFCWRTYRWRASASRQGKLFFLYQGPSKEKAVEARKQWDAENGR